MDNPATPDEDWTIGPDEPHPPAGLWPPAGSYRDDDGNLLDADGNPLLEDDDDPDPDDVDPNDDDPDPDDTVPAADDQPGEDPPVDEPLEG